MTKLSGPARDGSNTSVFAPLTYEIDDGHTVWRDGKRLTELSACTREFLAISRSKETSTVSRRWSELGAVEVVILGHLSGPEYAYDKLGYLQYTLALYSVPPRTLSFLFLCIRILSFY